MIAYNSYDFIYLSVYTKKSPSDFFHLKTYRTRIDFFNKRKANKEYRKELRTCKKMKKKGEIIEFKIQKYY